jgi:hypothetical protein
MNLGSGSDIPDSGRGISSYNINININQMKKNQNLIFVSVYLLKSILKNSWFYINY